MTAPHNSSALATPDALREQLRSVFGFARFRAGQEEVCRAAIDGRDLLLVMPTGAGKSLCYQLPTILRGGTALVISPLIALMEDQAAKLTALGLRVARIHSGLERAQARQACADYLQGTLQFLFIAPERLRVPGFVEMLAKKKLALIAIDEAHCISQWGHDFQARLQDAGPIPAGAARRRCEFSGWGAIVGDDRDSNAYCAGGYSGAIGNGAAGKVYSWIPAREPGYRGGGIAGAGAGGDDLAAFWRSPRAGRRSCMRLRGNSPSGWPRSFHSGFRQRHTTRGWMQRRESGCRRRFSRVDSKS